MLGAPAILPGVPAEAKRGFGPLKALLDVISAAYADRQVRLRLPTCNPPGTNTSLQGTITVRNKVGVLLPRIKSLNALFATPPSDVEDLRSRDKLI